MARKACLTCRETFLGRANAAYCSPTCRQRAHRSRTPANRDKGAVTVTVTAGASIRHPGHSPQALALLAALDGELAANAEQAGQELEWSAAEATVRGMIADAIDRRGDLATAYQAAPDDVVRVKLSGELRLLEQSIARLLKHVRTDLPPRDSSTTEKARRAANTRWEQDAARRQR